MRVGIFDSGIGGLNVLKEIIKKYPNNEYIYYGDTLNVPYGTKTIEKLNELSSNMVEFLINKKVDLIIIACGTVSTTCYDYLRKKYKVKIIDVISPAIKYLNKSKYEHIGAIATKRTIDSNALNKIKKLEKQVATIEFASLIEQDKIEENLDLVKKYCSEFNNIDCLLLACTHYPMIKKILNNYLKVDYIDLGKVLIEDLDLKNDSNYKLDMYFTKIDKVLKNNINKIIKTKYNLYDVEEII